MARQGTPFPRGAIPCGIVAMGATAVPKYIDENAAGSGMPQMKSILSGFVINRYMSFKTLCSKSLGLSIAFAASSFFLSFFSFSGGAVV